ncbi:hypothetical protein ANCCAN_27320 [Ancylostoma caninum]|uniref:Uncharacterized protein n=1 Tax=Ancylostoma caninum TaxID=29170 RepID=A0A368F4I3_ANCCA|nr:hypothetical protein ANCCAN_27320 [Ancylostoma caninum]
MRQLIREWGHQKKFNGRELLSRFFVQWVECSVVLVVGFIINIIRGFPQFEWVAAIGGVLYATGRSS